MKSTRTFTRTMLACLAVAVTVISTDVAAASAVRAGALPGPNLAAGNEPAGAVPFSSLGTGLAGLAALTLPALTLPAPVPPGHAFPLWRLPGTMRPGQRPGGQAVPRTIGEPGGYDPAELRAYLGLHGTGAGQTVAVTEAYDVQNPLPVALVGRQDDVTAALASYDSFYGLPRPCSAARHRHCFRLTFTAPHGTGISNPLIVSVNWALEAELDVEMIHALVPRAAIVVVEGRDNTAASMLAAVDYARSLHPAAVSNSWTEDETAGERAMNGHCPAAGPICVFSSGDCGNYATSTCPAGSIGGYPAADPGVLAVGGTTLDLTVTGKVRSETGWSGSGGGTSRYEPLPGYQRSADFWRSGRGVPDVSFDADPNSGIATYLYITYHLGGQQILLYDGWQELGGTSVGAPAWAAILAAAAQLRAAARKPPLTITTVHAAVYARRGGKPLADITAGANGLCPAACSAWRGYDLVTGEGSPRQGIVSYLAGY